MAVIMRIRHHYRPPLDLTCIEPLPMPTIPVALAQVQRMLQDARMMGSDSRGPRVSWNRSLDLAADR